MPSEIVLTNDKHYNDIASAIRNKNGLSTLYKPSEMAEAINALVVGGTITLQDKTVNPSEETQTITHDTGYMGLGEVTVTPILTEVKTVTENGNVYPTTGKYLTRVTVNVPQGGGVNNQNKSVTPTESQQLVTYDNGYTGLGTVTVGAISSTYVGSGITQRSSTDLTASGATVTVPAGYYSSQASKAVSSGSATGPSSLSASSATVSTGTNTITLTKTGVTTTPTVSAGYVSSATSSTATVALTASVTTKSATTYTPGTTNQTIASGTYLTGTQTISGDADLVSENIKKNVNIFGVTGTYEGESSTEVIADDVSTLPSGGEHHNIIGVDISQDTVTARTLVKNYTAHDAEGNAITGIFEGGEIEYEEGTINLPTTTSNYDITFSNTHTSLPTFYIISLASNVVYINTFISTVFSLTENIGVPQDENYGVSYGVVAIVSIGSSSYSTSSVIRLTKPSSNLSESDTSYPRYWATETRIRIPASASKPISGPYKWLAVWNNFNSTGE